MNEGNVRRLDMVLETKLKGKEAVIIIHVEPQSSQQTHFHERMFLYFNMLYNKYRKPIVPIAIFSYQENWERDEYTMAFPFHHVLTSIICTCSKSPMKRTKKFKAVQLGVAERMF
ncbi:RpnC/YadD family protein [Gracilibacillus alcaliphilus]|uniref:hypothetical protein n=1 Tax=Gracilibacillus alcaliphilus TaxID=1401441 RepID=UPI00195CFC9A|nr:hypothetical protein [Gracilibacillus alcaliphilus]MBM7675833.1 hypothetical protein [Gracilibacillus alcaliphilus]